MKLTTIALLALFTPVVAAQGPSPQERATAMVEETPRRIIDDAAISTLEPRRHTRKSIWTFWR